jgi:protein-tyrosine phosphatase
MKKEWMAIGCLALLAACTEQSSREQSSREQSSTQSPVVESEASSSHFVAMDGARNIRDIGGYKTEDGQVVKKGLIYRADQLSRLSDNDWQTLQGLDVTEILDLRRKEEQSKQSTQPPASYLVSIRTYEYPEIDEALMKDVITKAAEEFTLMEAMTDEELKAALIAGASSYHQTAYQQRDAFRDMFKRLAANDTPLMFHCTGGRDRTGFGAALILIALGVTREQVLDDYELSAEAVQVKPITRADIEPLLELPGFKDLSVNLVNRIWEATNRESMEIALASIASEHGSLDNYLMTELGVTPEMRSQLRENFLEPSGT